MEGEREKWSSMPRNNAGRCVAHSSTNRPASSQHVTEAWRARTGRMQALTCVARPEEWHDESAAMAPLLAAAVQDRLAAEHSRIPSVLMLPHRRQQHFPAVQRGFVRPTE